MIQKTLFLSSFVLSISNLGTLTFCSAYPANINLKKTWKPVHSESLRKASEFVLEDEKELSEIWLQPVI